MGDLMASEKQLMKWIGDLSDEDLGVCIDTTMFLRRRAHKSGISSDVPAVLDVLVKSEGDFRGRMGSMSFLEIAAATGGDISISVPTLLALLSDGDRRIREKASETLGCVTYKTDIDLEEVEKALRAFVDKEGRKGISERKNAAGEASQHYYRIAKAVSKRKAIEMAGEMLPGKIKPPKGPKIHRTGRTVVR
jgi:hypothetical protein